MSVFAGPPAIDSTNLWFIAATTLLILLIFRETIGRTNTTFGRALSRLATIAILPLTMVILVIVGLLLLTTSHGQP